MKDQTRRRVYAVIDGASRVIDVAGAQYHDPRRYTHRVIATGVSAALAGDCAALSRDGRRVAAEFELKKP